MYIDKSHLTRKEFLKKVLYSLVLTNGILSENILSENQKIQKIKLRNKNISIRSIVFINMMGGMSHIDTFDYKNNSQFSGIKSSAGIYISEVFPYTAKVLKYFTMVRSLYSETGDHKRAQYLLNTGKNLLAGFKDAPSFGSVIAKALEKENEMYFPNFISMGAKNEFTGNAGFLGTRYQAFHISNVQKPLSYIKNRYHWLDSSRFKRRELLLEFLNENFDKRVYSKNYLQWKEYFKIAVEFMNSEKLTTFDWRKEKEQSREHYLKSNFGIALLIAKRCIRQEIPFIQITLPGWDTHNNNKERITKLAKEIDYVFYHFINELKAEGLWDQTIIYLNSEFGRKPELAPNGNGRDHHPNVWTCLIGGGNIPENYLVGESDKKGKEPVKNPVTINDIFATIYTKIGIDYRQKLYTSDNRPYLLVQNGEPII